ncbi:hypothetical protein UFOVP1329_28 [uncultured Caudovirales phage]|uniref:Uncharacterized protein n=1 Tax=uncultured Caudovirales phage TaxID=2100421 RepID=A0A6J5STA4_9CAUD|nr:hypothetical protein UFOVP1150_9 [uncultured Caudovirales phage]CAB4199199.1 hypothetical protein UFOVP1329_28 [uncultured Caudovirales phage]CAB4218296.1 hypothetical protein UFOVP1595_8 [uncultured Caudovirales phage]
MITPQIPALTGMTPLGIKPNPTLIWVVTTPSAYRSGHTCLIGSGKTKAEAIEDAYGPKDSWGNSTKRAVRNADIYQVTEEEYHNLHQ